MKEAELQKICESFGNRIRTLRKAQNYTQEEFAHKCHMHRTYLSDVERGERNISLDYIIKIANTLDISVSELFNNIK